MKKVWLFCILMAALVFMGTAAEAASTVDHFTWMGQKEDKVGQASAKADTILDGKFKLELFLPAKTYIKSIMVSTVNPEGTPVGKNVWHTKNQDYPLIGVYYKNSKGLINESHINDLGVYSGKTLFYLYLSDVTQDGFATGKHFKVDVLLGNGEVLTSIARQGYR